MWLADENNNNFHSGISLSLLTPLPSCASAWDWLAYASTTRESKSVPFSVLAGSLGSSWSLTCRNMPAANFRLRCTSFACSRVILRRSEGRERGVKGERGEWREGDRREGRHKQVLCGGTYAYLSDAAMTAACLVCHIAMSITTEISSNQASVCTLQVHTTDMSNWHPFLLPRVHEDIFFN